MAFIRKRRREPDLYSKERWVKRPGLEPSAHFLRREGCGNAREPEPTLRSWAALNAAPPPAVASPCRGSQRKPKVLQLLSKRPWSRERNPSPAPAFLFVGCKEAREPGMIGRGEGA